MSNTLLPCPFCGGEATMDSSGKKYQVWCKRCSCIHMGEFYNTEAEAITAWNRRADARQLALKTRVCPMCEDCPDGCPVETPNDSRNKPENEPLTLDELMQMGGEPVYCVDAGGSGAWALVHTQDEVCTDANYGDWEFYCYGWRDNGKMNENGWLAYRRKPERSEG